MILRFPSLWARACKLVFFILCGSLFFYSCTEEKEQWATPSVLAFSNDTVRFDSVFESEVSPTKLVRIYNRARTPVRIPRLSLVGGEQSPFSLLIDGVSASQKENLRIEASDSLTVVIRLRPIVKGVNALLLTDAILVEMRQAENYRLRLEAWGLPHSDIGGGEITEDTDWVGAPAKIISDKLVVPEGVTLRLSKGAAIYFRPKASLVVKGRLIVEGATNQPILFAGTRLDSGYKHTPGQWQGVLLMPGSGPHYIRNAVFRSAVTAIRTDSVLEGCSLENVIITGCSRDAIALRKTTFRMIGCIVAQNTGAALSLKESNVTMDFCTLQGDTRFGQSRRSPLIYFDEQPEGTENLLSVFNSIVWGSYANEIRTSEGATGETIRASHSIVKWTQNRPAPSEQWNEILYTDPLLTKPSKLNFELTASSPARSSGIYRAYDEKFYYDLKGRRRMHSDGTIDRGALVYEEKNNRKP